MTKILYILTSIWYINIPKPILSYVLQKLDTSALVILCKKGHYKTRLYISEHLFKLNPFQQIVLSNLLMEDSIERISQNAIRFINNTQIESLTYVSTQKAMFWEAKRLQQIQQIKKRSKPFDRRGKEFKRKFGNGESFKLAKERLKRPIKA